MNILLCNERFLFRFGVDRLLILLGQGLRDSGHRISVMANKFDQPIVEEFSEEIISVPEGGDSYLNLNEFTAQWLDANWAMLFDEDRHPDVAVIGGWPFFAAIPVFERHGCRTVFIDCGAVPIEGFDEGGKITQEKLRNLRKEYMPQLSLIAPISHFIANSQSSADAGSVSIEPILLGADHMSKALWRLDSIKLANQLGMSIANQIIEKNRKKGGKTILNLGRWEPGCYKNSEAIFKFVDEIVPHHSQISILILADQKLTKIPEYYRDKVIPIGFPDDAELQAIMAQVDLGVSVSLWEGFNLPLAEMQWLDKPVLAFNIGAHAEVVIHPWFLCQEMAEMGIKAIELLEEGGGPDRETLDYVRERFHADFRWQAVVKRYNAMLKRVVMGERFQAITVLVDVTNASRDPANSGVIRVTRRLCRELQQFCQPLFVAWGGEDQGYVFLTRAEYRQLSQFNGPNIGTQAPCSPDGARLSLTDAGVLNSGASTWLLLTETIQEVNGQHIRNYAKRSGIWIGAIFYDAIPIIRPELVMDAITRNNHAHYMKGLAHCDLVIPISQFSAQSLRTFWAAEGLTGCEIKPNLLPGEFGGAARVTDAENRAFPKKIDLLCVSTLEPRKNHRKLIEAIKLFAHQHPEVDWSLTLIGNRYAGGNDIAEFVEEACRDNSRIRWLGIVDDIRLHQAYTECTFTIYASEIEGFGMPILESIWHGKPCICHEMGVMSELAAGGGCLMVDVMNIEKMAAAIGELATKQSLYEQLTQEAITRPIKTWEEYAHQFWNELINHSILQDDTVSICNIEGQFIEKNQTVSAPTWLDVLYQSCLTQEWQMNDSERLGLAAVLQRLNPNCAIEIGTYRGGSLSLISQYVDNVFSIDIDPSIPEKFNQFDNVSFFTGSSHVIMPMLLQELDNAQMPVEFVLIDGDHSAAGVKQDINIMLNYIPKKPLIVMIYNGFNPECRRGMLEADWQKSLYVQYIDLDFIPGRVIEHGNNDAMQGGLAMAYFSPNKRRGKIDIGATALRMYAEMKERHYD
ncbi:glycosyltransferase [Methylobacter marinus]|uniref:glycosyltransferase n=1 Tax=Methylobacter marinus TaxID=34058 RepID=UPI00039C00C2|nr:glycosyltransferase [Methylobacter marinus]